MGVFKETPQLLSFLFTILELVKLVWLSFFLSFFGLKGFFFCIQMVFRLDPGKFKNLKHEFGEFLKRVTYLFDDLIKNIEIRDLQVMIGEICNWQVLYTTDCI